MIVKDLLAIMHRNALSSKGCCHQIQQNNWKYIGQHQEKSHVNVTSSSRPFSWKMNANEAPSEAFREESKFGLNF